MSVKSKKHKLEFAAKEKNGKGANRKLRAKKMVPAVVYGPDFKGGVAGSVSSKIIAPIANGAFRKTTILELVMPDG